MANNSSQEAIRAKCFHPSGAFIPFSEEEVERSIPSRFEEIVRRYPDRIAVKSRNHALTYGELNDMANRVAHAILQLRGEGEKAVALLLEHGAPMIVGMLGVLKAGKFYVPLDPSLPPLRITYILADSQAELIVTNNQNIALARESGGNGRFFLNIDDLDSSPSAENLGLFISPDTLAYILYTSGSTGQPKGAIHNHRNVLHDCLAYTNNFHFCALDRMTLLHSCSFSASQHNLFGALLNGAAIYPFDIKAEGLSRLATWLIQEKITIYHSGVVVYRHFFDTLTGQEDFPDLRVIKLGGEQVSKKDVELYKKQFPAGCILVHSLSSTEASTVLWHFIDKEAEITSEIVPVGYPVEDMDILLLDDNGKEVGCNEIGEIAVRSHYLASGYWRMPALTPAVFLPDPRGGNQRIYLTGDLGRMRPDGCLEHLGRTDFQVKVRGYRVEVSEIEMRLLEHPAVKEVAVVGRETQTGDKRLVAYLVPTRQPAASVRELRSFLKDRLPDYMIPSAFVMLDVLPLTPTGKVDRRALPAPAPTRPDLDISFVSPRTPLEEVLAGIWAEVLGLDQVGIHDSFLDLGGDSLLATQIISRVTNAFGVELPIQSLLEAPTLAEMAVVVTQNQAKKAGEENLTRMLAELELLSNEEAKRFLTEEQREKGT